MSMARTIKEIQDGIILSLQEQSELTLSTSKVAEWRLWTYVFAVAIYTFEIILDAFRSEIDAVTNKITPGTVRWYAEMCYRFQNGHELLFDADTAMLYYARDDAEARIVKVVAIREETNKLVIKAAKQDADGRIVPLELEERYNFSTYIDAIKFCGVDVNIISTKEDRLRYNMEVYIEPSIPVTLARKSVEEALECFKTSIGFDSIIYKQRFIDSVMGIQGVVTCNLIALDNKGAVDDDFIPVGIYSELKSGYFEYDEGSVLTIRNLKELEI